MPRLTALRVKQAKPKEKPYKLYDERGLFLLVNPNGSKLWRFRYRYCNKEQLISLGPLSDISLSEARELRRSAQRELIEGINPSESRKARRRSKLSETATIEIVGREWLAARRSGWKPSHYSKVQGRLEREIFPPLGSVPIAEIGALDLWRMLRRIADSGRIETAHRVKQVCSQVLRYAVVTGRAERDVTVDLKRALPPPARTHHAAIIDPNEIGALLRAIDGYSGTAIVRLALMLAPLVFTRPGELRSAEWGEISLDRTEWRIPAEKMKSKRIHVVPLSRQAQAIIRELRSYSAKSNFLFPSLRSLHQRMSENTLNAALRRLGYSSDEMTSHGFRSMASTLLNEAGWNRDAIERQLAHAERDEVRAAYNYADHLDERREMMQAWADYLDRLRQHSPGSVTPRLQFLRRALASSDRDTESCSSPPAR